MNDKSMTAPGPMGWGEEFESHDSKVAKEKRAFADLAANAPRFVVRRAAKPEQNQVIAGKIKVAMDADGMTDGCDLTQIEKAIFGSFLNYKRQLIGSCVASGGFRCFLLRMLFEIGLLGDGEEFLGHAITGRDNMIPFAPYSYRAGRRLGGMNGNGDGSYCTVHTQGAMQFGLLPCSVAGLQSDDFPEPQDESLYRRWGANNSLMDQFVGQAKVYRLLESEDVSSVEDAKSCIIDHKKPLMICSNWAFKPDYVHKSWKYSNGKPATIYTRDTRNSWGHNMSIVGIFYAVGEWWVKVKNSWGMDAHSDGDFFVIPLSLFGDWVPKAEIRSVGDIDLADSGEPFPLIAA